MQLYVYGIVYAKTEPAAIYLVFHKYIFTVDTSILHTYTHIYSNLVQ